MSTTHVVRLTIDDDVIDARFADLASCHGLTSFVSLAVETFLSTESGKIALTALAKKKKRGSRAEKSNNTKQAVARKEPAATVETVKQMPTRDAASDYQTEPSPVAPRQESIGQADVVSLMLKKS